MRQGLAAMCLAISGAVAGVVVVAPPASAWAPHEAVVSSYVVTVKDGIDPQFVIDEAGIDNDRVDFIYRDVLNGFAARLTIDEVAALNERPDVVSMVVDSNMSLGADAGNSADLPQPEVIPGQYIVQLRDNASYTAQASAMSVVGEGLGHVYNAVFKGFSAGLNYTQVKQLRDNPAVAIIEPDTVIRLEATQTITDGGLWNLDRIDQATLPRDGSFKYQSTGSGVTAYVIDTGIASHSEFGNRVRSGYTAISDGNGTNDCNGHGTHVAGTIGGATYGVAKDVSLVAVRVLDCSGSGTNSGIIAAINWIKTDHTNSNAVANMSLGGSYSSTLNTAVTGLYNDGIVVAVAAGNSNLNACNYSPASVTTVLTVGASTTSDARSSYSNYGSCIDLFAPGDSILSAGYTGGSATMSGTSMATPLVTGAAAVYWSTNPTKTYSQVSADMVSTSTVGKMSATNLGTGSPNKLLYLSPGVGMAPSAPQSVAASVTSGLVTVTWSAPSNAGSSPVTSYVVTASPGGSTCTWSSGPLSCQFGGLGVGTYTFTATATNNDGTSVASAASNSVSIVETNNSFSAATVFSGASGSLSDNNSSATTEANEPAVTGVGTGGGATLWYKAVPSGTGTMTVSTAGSTFDTIIEVFRLTSGTTESITNLTLVSSNDDYGGNYTSYTTASVTQNKTYYVRVSSYGTSRGAITFSWTLPESCVVGTPTNDYFCNAKTLTGTSGSQAALDITSATSQTGEPVDVSGKKNVWYAFTSNTLGTFDINASASNFAPVIAVYRGSSLAGLSLDTKNSSGVKTLSFSVVANTQYYIAFADSSGGSLDFSWSFTAGSALMPPSAPTGLVASPGNGSISVSWNVPTGGGAPSSYTAVATPGNQSCTASPGSATSCVITGLTNYTSYTVSLTARNSNGSSSAVTASGVMPFINNDMFANALAVSGSTGTISGSNTNATFENGEPSVVSRMGGKTVWYRYTPTVSGTLEVNTIGSTFDTILGVFTGSSVSSLTSVAENDDGGSGGTSSVSMAVSANVTYNIVVAGYYTYIGGSISLSWTFTPAPLPGAPTAVVAAPGELSATVRWTAPTSGLTPSMKYRAVSSPDGRFCETTGSDTECDVTGLRLHVTYTFTVTAANDVGIGSASAPSNSIYIEESVSSIRLAPSWGLDRIDERSSVKDGLLVAANKGEGITVYVIDTGVRASHSDFVGRVSQGYSAVVDGNGTDDCDGHGTHVASIAAGTKYGVASKATIVPVRVLDCEGSGTTSGVIAGLNWVAKQPNLKGRSVVNLSLGGDTDSAIDTAVQNLIDAGVVVVVAAGNDASNACQASPARLPAAITVGATTQSDGRADFSNYGSCVDIFAPGYGIVAAGISGADSTETKSGTSMATPHVTGVVAVLLSSFPGRTPTQIASGLVAAATSGVVTNTGSGSPNKLLYVPSTRCSVGSYLGVSCTSGLTVLGTSKISAILKLAGITVPAKAKVKVIVAKASAKVCKVVKQNVRKLKAGTCRLTIQIVPKKGKTKTRVMKVSMV